MADSFVAPKERRPGRSGAGKNRRALVGFTLILMHLPNYTRLGWSLLRDGRLNAGQRALVLAGIGYLALPLDLVPGVIPIAGQLDDLAAIILALRAVVRSLPPAERARHLAAAELSLAAIDQDLQALGNTAIWLVARVGGLVAAGVAGLAKGALRMALGSGRH